MSILVLVTVTSGNVFVRESTIFIEKYDFEFNYVSVWTLLYSQVNLQIVPYNWFDQIPYATLHALGGLYTPDHVLAAAVLWLPNLIVPEVTVSLILPTVLTINVLFRSAFAYFLLGALKLDRITKFVAVVVLNCVLSLNSAQGWGHIFLYSYALVVVRLAMTLVSKPTVIHFAWFLSSLASAVAFSPLFTLGYFWQAIFLMLLILLCARLILTLLKRRQLQVLSLPDVFSFRLAAFGGLIVACIGAIFSLGLAAVAWSDTGQGSQESRFGSALQPWKYFALDTYSANVAKLPSSLLDFASNNWGAGWIYVGALVLALCLFGVLLGASPWRWVFLAFFVALLLFSSDRPTQGIASIVHYVTALLNPLAFLIRSTHMVSSMMLFVPLFVLLALGIQSVVELLRAKRTPSGGNVAVAVAIALALCGIQFGISAATWSDGLPNSLSRSLGKSVPTLLVVVLIVAVMFYLWQAKRRSHQRATSNLRRRGLQGVVAVLFLGTISAQGLSLWVYDTKFSNEMEYYAADTLLAGGDDRLERTPPSNDAVPLRVDSLKNLPETTDREFLTYGQSFSRGPLLQTIYFDRYSLPVSQYNPRASAYVAIALSQAWQRYVSTVNGFVEVHSFPMTGITSDTATSATTDQGIEKESLIEGWRHLTENQLADILTESGTRSLPTAETLDGSGLLVDLTDHLSGVAIVHVPSSQEWSAKIDGVTRPLVNAGPFVALQITEGDQYLQLRYVPSWYETVFAAGLWVFSILFTVTFMAFAFSATTTGRQGGGQNCITK